MYMYSAGHGPTFFHGIAANGLIYIIHVYMYIYIYILIVIYDTYTNIIYIYIYIPPGRTSAQSFIGVYSRCDLFRKNKIKICRFA